MTTRTKETEKQTKTARIEARVTPDTLALMKRAAELQGRSVSDFMTSAALEAARATISQTEIIQLSREASEQFAELLVNPPEPTGALLQAVRHRRQLIR